MNLLETYVRAWRESVDAIIDMASAFTEADWLTGTDCPGWTVKDVVGHLAHLESELCRTEQDVVVAGDSAGLVPAFTEAGVAARKDRTPAEVTAELTEAVRSRATVLADLPEDESTPAPITPGGVAWTWDTLLRNRAVDAWVHEQDIRRAVGRPGGLASTGAQVVTMTFSFAMPYVLGKRVRPVAGSVVRWDVTGDMPLDLVVQIGDDGRASAIELFDVPTATLSMTSETFTLLAAGRRTPDHVHVDIEGDPLLGRATLDAMAVTP